MKKGGLSLAFTTRPSCISSPKYFPTIRGNFDNAEWWQLMTMGCEVSSRVNEQLSIGIKSLTRQTIAVSVEDSARGLLKAIQTEPLLALAGSGPNKPGDSG